jgi:IS605 OrfB family transposase
MKRRGELEQHLLGAAGCCTLLRFCRLLAVCSFRRLARIHVRVANIRRDALHKASTRPANTHGQVVLEDLGVRQLARGLHSHRKAWADAAAGELRRQLTSKAEWYG